MRSPLPLQSSGGLVGTTRNAARKKTCYCRRPGMNRSKIPPTATKVFQTRLDRMSLTCVFSSPNDDCNACWVFVKFETCKIKSLILSSDRLVTGNVELTELAYRLNSMSC